jgi:hypothetical protein
MGYHLHTFLKNYQNNMQPTAIQYFLLTSPFLLLLLGTWVWTIREAYTQNTVDDIYRKNGSGLALLGKREIQENGSYISTKWM